MEGTCCAVKICMSHDGHVLCCDFNCTAGGAKENEFRHNNKNMLCMHTCPSIMKFSAKLRDYLADDIFMN